MGTNIINAAAKDTRIPLKPGTHLKVFNSQGGQIVYTIEQMTGRGGSSLVYSGYYAGNSGVRKPVRIKECYPFGMRVTREESGELTVDERDRVPYEKAAARLKEAFVISNELFRTGGLTNSISNALDLYEANHTVYMITAYLEGEVLTPELSDSLKDVIVIVKSVAGTIRKIHDRGYLYLDIKPENVFVLKNVTELSVLFDFDSLVAADKTGEAESGAFRFTRGFAALELRTGNGKQIGKHTDVYGVGALLYYLIFGRTPEAPDCDNSVIYNYSGFLYASDSFRDKLYDALTDFFHHTLPSAWQDRYPDLAEAEAKLAEIEKLADLTKPFICDSYIPDRVFITGRSQEEKRLVQWLLDREKKCLFVTGMGGIGKSTLVRSCISGNREVFDTVLYLYYNGSVSAMIGDDRQLCVNTVERTEKESDEDYFKRKLHVLRQIISGTCTLLVIDDFNGKVGRDFYDVLQAGWKVIVITRNENKGLAREYDTIKVEAIQEREALYELFAVNMEREIREEERIWLDLMAAELQGHTLALELLAKQTARSCLTVREAAKLARQYGFSGMAPEKVDYVKDGKLYYERISGIITALFSGERMQENKKILLKMLALFDMPGVGMEDFRRMLDKPPLDLFHELREEGWIQMVHGQTAFDRDGSAQTDSAGQDNYQSVSVYLSLHSVIRETVRQWEWEEQYREPELRMLQWLLKMLRPEGMKEEYPKEFPEDRKDYPLWKKDQEGKYQKRGRTLNYYLRLAVNVLDSLRRDGILNHTMEYKELLYRTILYMPRHREKYILTRSGELLQGIGVSEPGQDRAIEQNFIEKSGKICCNPRVVLSVCDITAFIYCEKAEYEQAYKKIRSVENMVRKQHNHHLWGMYYAILSQYYDALLQGAYDAWSEEEKEILYKLLRTQELAVRHMRKAKERDSGQCLTRYMLEKAALLIRSGGNAGEIKRLLDRGKLLMEKHVLPCSEIRQAYYLTCGWYYTMSEPDYKRMEASMRKACEIADKRKVSELDRIDFIMVPYADMLLIWKKAEPAEKRLMKGIDCCNQYPYSLPFIRKKMELYSYLLDVYLEERDFARCRDVIEIIDRENRNNKWAEIQKEVPEEIRKAVFD